HLRRLRPRALAAAARRRPARRGDDTAGLTQRGGPMPDAASLFPAAEAVPEAWRHAPDDTGLTLLVDGAVTKWSGPSAPIRSAVCVRDGDRLRQVELGPGALASAAESLAALEAATRAWRGGRGDWPRASVEERIACIEAFARRAAPLRERVARALMWEVGK